MAGFTDHLTITLRYRGLQSPSWPTIAKITEQGEDECSKVVSLDLCGNKIEFLEDLSVYKLLLSLSLSQNRLVSLSTGT